MVNGNGVESTVRMGCPPPHGRFEFLLFSTCTDMVRRAADAGVDGVVVDWEFRGKPERQRGANTQINNDSLADLVRIRKVTTALIIVRINGFNSSTALEIEQAIHAGADEILLPMVNSVDQVKATIDLVNGRAALGILVETLSAVARAAELSQLPLRRVYVGLNDLAIQRKSRNIFEPLIDGLLDQVREKFNCAFGFGGLTLPDLGCPIPCRLLMAEMARLHTSFCFLRRSFLADVAGKSVPAAIADMRQAILESRLRPQDRIASDRAQLVRAVETAIRASDCGLQSSLACRVPVE